MASDWEYAGVYLSIDNYTIPPERLSPTPSSIDGLDPETEFCLRYLGSEFIQEAGILLKLPQVAMATAQVLYQRYFFSKSFVRYVYEHYAMASIFLAAKIEENPRRIREVINVFHHIKQVREGKPFTPVMFDQSYANLKNHIIKAERRVLKELGFCVHGKHPHKLIIMYLKSLSLVGNQSLIQMSWNCMNDVLRTDVFVRYSPEAVACACIFLAARKLQIALPRHPPWWEMFNVDEDSVYEIALCLQRLYVRPKPNISAIEQRLAELRKKQAEEKEAAQAAALAARVLVSKQAAESDSGNPSPANNVDQNSQANGSDVIKRVSPESEQLQPIKRDHISESTHEPKAIALTENTLNQVESQASKPSSHRPVERRKPSAYSESEPKPRKPNKHRNRSRSPIPKRRNSKTRRRRYSSSTVSYSSGSADSPHRSYSRKESDSRHRRRDQRDSRKKHIRSPLGDGKSRRNHPHHNRRRSASSYSSISSRSDRSPPPSLKVSSSRDRSPPRNASRMDNDRKPSSSKISSKHINGISSSSTSSSARHIPVISSSKNRGR